MNVAQICAVAILAGPLFFTATWFFALLTDHILTGQGL